MTTSHRAVMLYGWGVKAGMAFLQLKLCWHLKAYWYLKALYKCPDLLYFTELTEARESTCPVTAARMIKHCSACTG